MCCVRPPCYLQATATREEREQRSSAMAKHAENSSQYPHFFRFILDHVLENGTLELPRNFVNKYGKNLSKYATLKLPTGVESKIELQICNGRAWLHRGWSDFVKKYSIQYGYFLVFRYLGGSRFNVLIFDLSSWEIDYPVNSAKTWNKKAEKCKIGKKEMQMRKRRASVKDSTALQRAKALKWKEPCFISVMQNWYRLGIPFAHSSRYLMDQHGKEAILHGLDGKTWPVRCYVAGSYARFTSGWKDFAGDNNLEQGDACVFELLTQGPNHYKFTLFRFAESSS